MQLIQRENNFHTDALLVQRLGILKTPASFVFSIDRHFLDPKVVSPQSYQHRVRIIFKPSSKLVLNM